MLSVLYQGVGQGWNDLASWVFLDKQKPLPL
jgi:hypothetical protein